MTDYDDTLREAVAVGVVDAILPILNRQQQLLAELIDAITARDYDRMVTAHQRYEDALYEILARIALARRAADVPPHVKAAQLRVVITDRQRRLQ